MVALGVMAALYLTGSIDIVQQFLNRDSLFLSDGETLTLGGNSGKVVMTEEGMYRIGETSVEYLGYDGKSNKREYDYFVDQVFMLEEPLVLTGDNKLFHFYNHQEILLVEEDRSILYIDQDDYIYVFTEDRDQMTNQVLILDDKMNPIGEIDLEKEKGIRANKSLNSNAFIVASFDYDGNYLHCVIREYLSKDFFVIWELEFQNEIVVEMVSRRDGLYVATNDHLYRINNQGVILWKYGRYQDFKDMEIKNDRIYLLEQSETTNIHILSMDGKLISRVSTEQPYKELAFYEDFLLARSNQYISYLKEDRLNLLYNGQQTIHDMSVTNQQIIVFVGNQIEAFKINRK